MNIAKDVTGSRGLSYTEMYLGRRLGEKVVEDRHPACELPFLQQDLWDSQIGS